MEVDRRNGVYLPHLLDERCNMCGICLDVCPGPSMDGLAPDTGLLPPPSDDRFLGRHMACYLSYATDHQMRYNSASGGVVTALLLFTLEKGVIDGALLTRMKGGRPLEPEPFVARSRADVLQAMGSKYCPVPANAALKEILEREGRYAVVGLPCHIRGIRKAEAAIPKLKERIVLHCGIFCSHQVSFRGTQLLLARLGIRSSDVSRISYRGQGWPGGITIELHDGRRKFVPNLPGSLWNTIFGGFFFVPPACLGCSDLTNEEADLSFGDAWLPEIVRTDQTGTSVVVARSLHAKQILEAAARDGVIHLDPLSPNEVIRSQRLFTHFKKTSLEWRLAYSRRRAHPGACTDWRKAEFRKRLVTAVIATNSRAGSSRLGMFAIRYLPLRILLSYVEAIQMLYRTTMKGDSPGQGGIN